MSTIAYVAETMSAPTTQKNKSIFTNHIPIYTPFSNFSTQPKNRQILISGSLVMRTPKRYSLGGIDYNGRHVLSHVLLISRGTITADV